MINTVFNDTASTDGVIQCQLKWEK